MVELGTVANVAEIVGGASVVAGLLYALWEVRRFRREERREAALALWQEIGTSESWSRAMRRVYRLPDDADPQVIEEDPERAAAVNQVATALNVHGFLAHDGFVPVEMNARAQAGVHLGLWRKIRRWVAVVEETSDNPEVFVWLRWWIRQLAEREPLDLPDVEELQDPLQVPDATASQPAS